MIKALFLSSGDGFCFCTFPSFGTVKKKMAVTTAANGKESGNKLICEILLCIDIEELPEVCLVKFLTY